jgi:hypothetical protein
LEDELKEYPFIILLVAVGIRAVLLFLWDAELQTMRRSVSFTSAPLPSNWQSAILSWEGKNASSVSIDPGMLY